MKNKFKLEKAVTNKEYKVYNLNLQGYSDECCMCWNQNRGCKRRSYSCHPLKGRNRNWKEFRKKQYKE